MSVDAARTRPRPRPERAIEARKRDCTAKVAAVSKVVRLLGRSGAPITRAAVSQLAGVSRSFTYENDEARAIIAAAQTRSQARAEGSIATITAQQEASWRERALNAEDRTRELRVEITTQRRLVSDLTGQLREPDGTWIEHDRNRLRGYAAPSQALPSAAPGGSSERVGQSRSPIRHRLKGAVQPPCDAGAGVS